MQRRRVNISPFMRMIKRIEQKERQQRDWRKLNSVAFKAFTVASGVTSKGWRNCKIKDKKSDLKKRFEGYRSFIESFLREGDTNFKNKSREFSALFSMMSDGIDEFFMKLETCFSWRRQVYGLQRWQRFIVILFPRRKLSAASAFMTTFFAIKLNPWTMKSIHRWSAIKDVLLNEMVAINISSAAFYFSHIHFSSFFFRLWQRL